MHVPTKARLAVAAVAASAVSMGMAAPSFAAAARVPASAPTVTSFGFFAADLQIHQDPNSSDPLATVFVITAKDTDSSAILTYSLDFGDNNSVSGTLPNPSDTVTVPYKYKAAGTYPVKLSVSDGTDTSDASQTYIVGQSTLSAQTTVTTTPGSLAVSADLSKCAPAHGQTITKVTLTWGDGSSVVIENPTPADMATPLDHTYASAGSYPVKTTVVDGDGGTVSATTAVVVGTPTPPIQPGGTGTAVSRIAGADRYQTAIAVSSKLPAGSAPAVVLATGQNFPDALAGAPLAKKVGGPLLLTPGTGPDAAAVTAEIKRVLKPGGTVYVLGGANAVPQSAVAALGAVTVTRIGGDDRYQTALKIADQLGDPSHVVLATGADYADALAAGPYAADVFGTDATHPAAILLTADTQLPAGVKAYLATAKAVAAVGGQAVTAAQTAHIALAPGASFRGYDRYFTAALVAAAFKHETTAGVATGENFADALTGAAYLAQAGGPLLLTPTHLLAPATWHALQGIEAAVGPTGTVEVFGGPAAVTDLTVAAIVEAVHGHMA